MVLLGLAWNFSFSSGTVMLTDCYRKEEAMDVQVGGTAGGGGKKRGRSEGGLLQLCTHCFQGDALSLVVCHFV